MTDTLAPPACNPSALLLRLGLPRGATVTVPTAAALNAWTVDLLTAPDDALRAAVATWNARRRAARERADRDRDRTARAASHAWGTAADMAETLLEARSCPVVAAAVDARTVAATACKAALVARALDPRRG